MSRVGSLTVMGDTDRAVLRAAALHLDRHRTRIEFEVNRRLGRAGPPPAARGEIVRRFRTFCRLASVDWSAARPSFDGLGGQPASGLESAIEAATAAAADCAPEAEIRDALALLSDRFRAGIRRSFAPTSADEEPKRKRRGKRRANAGKRVRAAIDRISDAYVALCLDTGTIYDLNPAAESLFGGDTDELLAREFSQLIGKEDETAYANLEARLDAGEDAGPLYMLLRRLSGEDIPVELKASTHTIGGRRLAILSVRERTEFVPEGTDYSTRTTPSPRIISTRESTARST